MLSFTTIRGQKKFSRCFLSLFLTSTCKDGSCIKGRTWKRVCFQIDVVCLVISWLWKPYLCSDIPRCVRSCMCLFEGVRAFILLEKRDATYRYMSNGSLYGEHVFICNNVVTSPCTWLFHDLLATYYFCPKWQSKFEAKTLVFICCRCPTPAWISLWNNKMTAHPKHLASSEGDCPV